MDRIDTIYSGESNFKKLMLKRVDGVLSDPYVAAATLKSLGFTGQAETHPMTVHSDRIHIVFSKQSVQPQVVDAFNRAIQQKTASGAIDAIIDKWLE